MRKRTKRLALHKETVRNLEERSLGRVVGASESCEHSCATECPYCPSLTYTEPSGISICVC